MSTLREKVRDQKYQNGFMTTDFPEISGAGIMNQRLLEKAAVISDRKSNIHGWQIIPGTDCIIRSIS